MIFEELELAGVWRVSLEPSVDFRGSFARSFCSEEFGRRRLPALFEQCSLSHNHQRGTLRGMHFQEPPFAESKFVRCVQGAIFDVALDLRPGSPTLGRWVSQTLTAENGLGLYVAAGLAHGFQTLQDATTVLYQITPPYQPGYERGVRWNDPAFAIEWPIDAPILSERDATYPDWDR